MKLAATYLSTLSHLHTYSSFTTFNSPTWLLTFVMNLKMNHARSTM